MSIKRRYSYSVLIAINIVMIIIRLKVFPKEPPSYHIILTITALLLFVLGWESTVLLDRLLEKIIPISKKPLQKICLQIFLSTLLIIFISYSIFFLANSMFDLRIIPMWNSVVYLMNFFIAVIFNLTIFGYYYFEEWKYNLVSRSHLEKDQAMVRYDALRNQLNPHFLFNALTSLNSLIFENQQLASEFLQQLSKVYRYTLQNRDKDVVSLKTEMDFVKHYISLMKTRFNGAIQFQIEIAEEDLEKGIVPVISQMLIENVVKHNSITLENPLLIQIKTDGTYLMVKNNVIKKTQVENSNKLGLENLKDLYKYLSDKGLRIESDPNNFAVYIPLIQ
ncbi:MAG TPA: hypothetical protein DCS66_02220 [Flavobacteriaceae bacterium]|nr:hypothetical protein [Flavobacteriaceae bacterium]HAT63402.1 hypothetical protein [Flavobacteriaceae bacterium]